MFHVFDSRIKRPAANRQLQVNKLQYSINTISLYSLYPMVYSECLIHSLSNELFTQSSTPQIKCIIENLATIIGQNERNLDKLFDFLTIYSRSFISSTNSSSSQFESNMYSLDNLRDNINRVYCLTNLIFRLFGNSNRFLSYQTLNIILYFE